MSASQQPSLGFSWMAWWWQVPPVQGWSWLLRRPGRPWEAHQLNTAVFQESKFQVLAGKSVSAILLLPRRQGHSSFNNYSCQKLGQDLSKPWQVVVGTRRNIRAIQSSDFDIFPFVLLLTARGFERKTVFYFCADSHHKNWPQLFPICILKLFGGLIHGEQWWCFLDDE